MKWGFTSPSRGLQALRQRKNAHANVETPEPAGRRRYKPMPWAKRSSRLATDRRALSGVVLSQLAKEGAPIICGSLPAYFEMKTMVDFMDMQSYLINLSCAEMMAHYGIPHAGTSGSGEGWGADLLSAGEIWANQLTSVIGKVGLAPFVGSGLNSKAYMPTQTVYANDVIAQARLFAGLFRR